MTEEQKAKLRPIYKQGVDQKNKCLFYWAGLVAKDIITQDEFIFLQQQWQISHKDNTRRRSDPKDEQIYINQPKLPQKAKFVCLDCESTDTFQPRGWSDWICDEHFNERVNKAKLVQR